jgi:tetratricopeptide (TPR) repeat protein
MLIALAVMFIVNRKSRGKAGAKEKPSKGHDAALKEANHRLAHNPKDPVGLLTTGDIYYQDKSWEQAYKAYGLLTGLAPGHADIDGFTVNLRYALCAQQLGHTNEAYRGFSAAETLKQDNFEVNYHLGAMEFGKKNYDKAVQLLQRAWAKDPEHAPTLRSLGHACFKLKRYTEAMVFIRKAIELAPEDKESLYTLAECYWEANQTAQALKIFTRLRSDPAMGPSACLAAGTINAGQHQEQRAIEDFEAGLKHASLKTEIALDLKYRLSTCYLGQNEIAKALGRLKEIQQTSPVYKDVGALISKYQEVNANRNLQLYMMAPATDFETLCRKLATVYYLRAKVKITDISVERNDWLDLLAEINTPKWSDLVMFRFIRLQGSIGEMIIRDFHGHLKEVKAGRGICLTVGAYTEEARHYTEARLIDLIEKDKLMTLLARLDTQSDTRKK